MSKEKNVFGINLNKTDTHMIKNSEWGAVAYLSQSKYGKYGNGSYEGRNKEVYINNSGLYYTGRSGGSYGGNTVINTVYKDHPDATQQYLDTGYYTYDGYLLENNTNKKIEKREMKTVASTTGNIYGIYDMSGGTWEYVIGVFANSDGEKWSLFSGFVGKKDNNGTDVQGLSWPNEKYYEVYKASSGTTISPTSACDGGVCFGHALSETAGWYGDQSNFVSSSSPWFIRSSYYSGGGGAGIFMSNYATGGNYGSTRVVLTQAT